MTTSTLQTSSGTESIPTPSTPMRTQVSYCTTRSHYYFIIKCVLNFITHHISCYYSSPIRTSFKMWWSRITSSKLLTPNDPKPTTTPPTSIRSVSHWTTRSHCYSVFRISKRSYLMLLFKLNNNIVQKVVKTHNSKETSNFTRY